MEPYFSLFSVLYFRVQKALGSSLVLLHGEGNQVIARLLKEVYASLSLWVSSLFWNLFSLGCDVKPSLFFRAIFQVSSPRGERNEGTLDRASLYSVWWLQRAKRSNAEERAFSQIKLLPLGPFKLAERYRDLKKVSLLFLHFQKFSKRSVFPLWLAKRGNFFSCPSRPLQKNKTFYSPPSRISRGPLLEVLTGKIPLVFFFCFRPLLIFLFLIPTSADRSSSMLKAYYFHSVCRDGRGLYTL